MNKWFIIIQLLAPLVGMGQTISFGPLGSGFNNAVYSPVRALFHDTLTNKLYAGGEFAIADGKTVWGAAVWENNSWDSLTGGLTQFPQLPPNNSSMGPVVYKIIRFQNKIYYTGGIDWVNGKNQYYMGIWNGTTWDYPISELPNGDVKDLKVYNGKLYACGTFTKFGNTICNYVAVFNGTNWQPVGDFSQFTKSSGSPSQMNAIAIYNSEVYVAGLFEDSTGTIRSIAKFDGTKWTNVGQGIQQGGSSFVISMEEFNGKLYIGGYFDKTTYIPGEALVSWNGANYEDPGARMVKGTFKSFTRSKDKLFVVANFYQDSTNYIPGIKFITTTSICSINGLLSTFTNSLNYSIECMETINDSLVVGGQFFYLDTVSANNIGVITNYENNSSCLITGIKENALADGFVKVYPNPVSNKLNLEFSTEIRNLKLTITNALGQFIYSKDILSSKDEIDVAFLNPGIYCLRIQTSQAQKVFKIIKE